MRPNREDVDSWVDVICRLIRASIEGDMQWTLTHREGLYCGRYKDKQYHIFVPDCKCGRVRLFQNTDEGGLLEYPELPTINDLAYWAERCANQIQDMDIETARRSVGMDLREEAE